MRNEGIVQAYYATKEDKAIQIEAVGVSLGIMGNSMIQEGKWVASVVDKWCSGCCSKGNVNCEKATRIIS